MSAYAGSSENLKDLKVRCWWQMPRPQSDNTYSLAVEVRSCPPLSSEKSSAAASVGVWECGIVGVWVCGSGGVWECGCVGVWDGRNVVV